MGKIKDTAACLPIIGSCKTSRAYSSDLHNLHSCFSRLNIFNRQPIIKIVRKYGYLDTCMHWYFIKDILVILVYIKRYNICARKYLFNWSRLGLKMYIFLTLQFNLL